MGSQHVIKRHFETRPMLHRAVVIASACVAFAFAYSSDDLVLISFPSKYHWTEQNDPVMGGQSCGNWSLQEGFGRFEGTVRNVSFLHAPGFCRAFTTSLLMRQDASKYLNGGLVLTVRTTTPSYKGFKIAFGAVGAPVHHGGHEYEGSFTADFMVPSSSDGMAWQTVMIPFNKFSYDWSDFTGECSTKDPDGYQHKCCSPETPDVCPTSKFLSKVNNFALWAEGQEGAFLIDMKEIRAVSK